MSDLETSPNSLQLNLLPPDDYNNNNNNNTLENSIDLNSNLSPLDNITSDNPIAIKAIQRLSRPSGPLTSSVSNDGLAERTSANVLSGVDGTTELNRGAEESWDAFLSSYSRGQHPTSSATRSYSAPDTSTPSLTNTRTPKTSELGDGTTPRRDSQSSSDSSATLNVDPAIVGPYEEERRRVVKRYGLDKASRQETIDRLAAIAQSHFRTATVIISLVLDNKQVLAAEIGWEGERDEQGKAVYSPLRELPLDLDVLQRLDADDCFVIEDARQDWRFSANPYAREGGKLSFFASAPINMPTAFPALPPSVESLLAGPKPPSLLPVGSICIIDREPRKDTEPFSEEDRMVLKSISDLIAREFQLGFEQQRRETEARQTAFLGEFLRTALVNPSRADKPLASDPHLKPHSTDPSSRPPAKNSDSQIQQAKSLIFQEAASNLTHLTQADTACILDLRAFSAPFPPARLLEVAKETGLETGSEDGSNSNFDDSFVEGGDVGKEEISDGYSGEASKWGATFSGLKQGTGVVSVMGQEGDFDWFSSVESPHCADSISNSLNAFYLDHISEFDSGTVISPLSKILPANTEASISVVIFDHDARPCLLLILCSFVKYFRFEPTDRQFVENVGAVAVGSLMRRRILEADRAKLAFVSQISHELRTPLHGIGSQIELIREVSTPAALVKLTPLLDTADVCISSLREVLDDTLEFAKISNSTQADSEATGRERQLSELDLEKLVEDVVKSCWSRTRKNAAVAGDSKGEVGAGTTGAGAQVDLIIQIDQRLSGWLALGDTGAIKRVLLNILGNALKFTTVGQIVISVYEEPLPISLRQIGQTGLHMIGISVQDSGIGMSQEFIREALFIPFKQSDPFSNGAGLGVSICDSIVRRMHGTLHFESVMGEGTTARVLLPLKLLPRNQSPISPTFPLHPVGPPIVRIISNELNSILDPVHIMNDAVIAAHLIEANAEAEAATRELLEPVISLPTPVTTPSTINTSLASSIPLMKNGVETKVTVLVVEDNAISRRILTTFLKAKGVPFAEAENGLEAVERYKAFRPNLIWCDVQMPKMNGLEATAAIRNFEVENSLTPAHIVALTGLSSESKLHNASLSSGQFDEWLVKGGPSLKILAAGLVRRQTVLDQMSLRKQLASTLQAGAQAILDGHFPVCLPSIEQLSFGGLAN